MKTLLLTLSLLPALGAFAVTEPSPDPQPANVNPFAAMIKRGEVYQLETVTPLIDGPDRVTILGHGPKSWVLVEYEASVLAPGELQPKLRKGQMWVNFDQVVAARKLTPEPVSIPPGR